MRSLSVGAWDPAEQISELSDSVLAELLAAADCLDREDLGLSAADASRLAATARLPSKAWQPAAALSDEQLIRLVRLYTLAEGRFPEWEAGSASPVIALCRLLRPPRRLAGRLDRLDQGAQRQQVPALRQLGRPALAVCGHQAPLNCSWQMAMKRLAPSDRALCLLW